MDVDRRMVLKCILKNTKLAYELDLFDITQESMEGSSEDGNEIWASNIFMGSLG